MSSTGLPRYWLKVTVSPCIVWRVKLGAGSPTSKVILLWVGGGLTPFSGGDVLAQEAYMSIAAHNTSVTASALAVLSYMVISSP
jgi:hypothetical protein